MGGTRCRPNSFDSSLFHPQLLNIDGPSDIFLGTSLNTVIVRHYLRLKPDKFRKKAYLTGCNRG